MAKPKEIEVNPIFFKILKTHKKRKLMKQFNYIFSALGWLGMIVCLVIIVIMNKCGGQAENKTIEKQTIINNYYDSSSKTVSEKIVLPGKPIPVFIPQDVDTAKILSAYFAKYPYKREFGDTSIHIELFDTICQNKFLSPGKLNYKWLKPVKTVESTTVTIKEHDKPKIKLFAGAHADFQRERFYDWGPEVFLQTKRETQFGINYGVRNQTYSVKTLINLNEAFRGKNK